jgi:hypothetical protein
MPNFFMRMNTVSLSSLQTTLPGEYFHESSHIPQTIQRSQCIYRKVKPVSRTDGLIDRVLLATLKFLAATPCPRCLIKKCDIAALGTKLDSRQRTQRRVDNESRWFVLERCRGWIYERGMKVRSKAVESCLGPLSWVPTRVCYRNRS